MWGFPLLQEKIFLQPPEEEISEALLAGFDFWTHLACAACVHGFLYVRSNLEKSGQCQFNSEGAYSIAPPNATPTFSDSSLYLTGSGPVQATSVCPCMLLPVLPPAHSLPGFTSACCLHLKNKKKTKPRFCKVQLRLSCFPL